MKTNLFNNIEEYKAPECKTLEIRFEGMMCTSPGGDDPTPDDSEWSKSGSAGTGSFSKDW